MAATGENFGFPAAENNFCGARNFLVMLSYYGSAGWLDNTHACFCVRADSFRGGVAMPCSNRPQI
jgi:hypothetical protein